MTITVFELRTGYVALPERIPFRSVKAFLDDHVCDDAAYLADEDDSLIAEYDSDDTPVSPLNSRFSCHNAATSCAQAWRTVMLPLPGAAFPRPC